MGPIDGIRRQVSAEAVAAAGRIMGRGLNGTHMLRSRGFVRTEPNFRGDQHGCGPGDFLFRQMEAESGC